MAAQPQKIRNQQANQPRRSTNMQPRETQPSTKGNQETKNMHIHSLQFENK